MSRTIEGLRCRINILQTSRGVGFAIRLLPAFQPTIETLNLHPDLKQLVNYANGLVLISGPTGSGKSTTLAALVQTINLSDARHIVTIESPIEFTFRPRKSFIRQREVGRDTPSFEQALLDSLREDPDVLMVGEMREPETMRLTLSAAETGHLVLATVHSANCAEALQRVVNAFPSEIQSNIAAQLADCLIGVVSQRLQFRPNLNICVPECEVLKTTMPIKNFIRNRDFFKIISTSGNRPGGRDVDLCALSGLAGKAHHLSRSFARTGGGRGGSRGAARISRHPAPPKTSHGEPYPRPSRRRRQSAPIPAALKSSRCKPSRHLKSPL